MKIIYIILTCSLVMLGCTSQANIDESTLVAAEKAVAKLNNSSVQSFDVVKNKIFMLRNGTLSLGDDTSVIHTAFGNSYYSFGEIPDNFKGGYLTIASIFDDTVLPLGVNLYDANYQLSRVIKSDDFSFEQGVLLSPSKLAVSIKLQQNEKYILFYANTTKIGQYVTVQDPNKVKEISTNIIQPNLRDIKVYFSPIGKFDISFNNVNSFLRSIFQHESEFNSKTSTQSVPTAVIGNKTKEFYKTEIKSDVEKGNIEEAISLVLEAEKLGYPDARNIFIEAVKSK